MTAALAAVGLAGATAGGAPPRKGVKTATCRQQAGAAFPHAFTNQDNVIVGPFAFSGLRRASKENPDAINFHGGWKSPALLRVRHRAVVTIDKGARSYARLNYTHSARGFRSQPHTTRFIACASGQEAISNADGKPITFWSGSFVLKQAPACVGIKIKVDRGHPRHRTIAIGQASCP